MYVQLTRLLAPAGQMECSGNHMMVNCAMARLARIHFASLKSSLVNLPISLYGPLVERSIRPQHLAVHLTLVVEPPAQKDQLEVWVGWTGMASASSLAQFNARGAGKAVETIEIDPQYALALGLKQGDVVQIGLLHDLPLATAVATEPLTPDDWQIIDIHASHVEATLLSQVRVAKIGQEMDVWVLGRTRVRLRVVSVQPEGRTALLLGTDTEVSIAPKPHARNQPALSPAPSPSPDAPARILRVLPPLPVPSPEETGAHVLGYVSPATFAALFPSHSPSALPPGEADTDTDVYHRTLLARLAPPADPSPSPSPPPPAPAPRVLHAGGGVGAGAGAGVSAGVGAGAHAGTTGDEDALYVRPDARVPENHVVVVASGLVARVEAWDVVRLSRPLEGAQAHIRVESPRTPPPPTTTTTPPPFLAGVDAILSQVTQFCVRSFASASLGTSATRPPSSLTLTRGPPALLLTGPPGAGKTAIVRAVAGALQADARVFSYTLYVDAARYAAQPVHSIKALLQYWLRKASWHRPSVLVLDNLERLHTDSFRTRHITELFLSIYSARAPNSRARGVVLLATAPSAAALHPALAAAHVFQEVVGVRAPGKGARKEILSRIIHDRLHSAPDLHLDPAAPPNYAHIATQTEGYSATDLQDLVAKAVHCVAVRAAEGSAPLLASTDFDAAQKEFVPLSLRGVKLQTSSEVSWSDIGGLRETRRVLRETLEWPTKYGPIFAQSPLRLRSGLLLYGFPGCGKTLLASAVAKECGLNFISVKGPEILNKYIGASEQSVRDLFERATAAKPCVLFFDEFDSIAPKRGHDSTGVTDRVVNQMLTQMDGAEGLDGVYVLAATSRPDLIDSALLRPGRLDKSLFCDMPDLEDRKDILQAVARKVVLSPSVDIDEIAAATAGYSGADLQALLYNAHLEVVHSSIASTPLDQRTSARDDDAPVRFTVIGGGSKTKVASRADEMALQRRLRQIQSNAQAQVKTDAPRTSTPKTQHEITSAHLSSVLKTMRPSVSADERARLDRIYRGFISDRSGELQVPPEAGGVGNRVSLM
ncbi:P-loop containing nucleoside triphosphate hydrolase protein [Mycena haematopus]|nr:P-loop containing nucleoside triphosphate hydrolase protein [Mycena haematopus]